MDEGQRRGWDVGLGIAAPLLTVAGLLVGVWEFNRGERNRVVLENQLLLQKDTIEFQRKLWLEKLDAYRALVILAGKIVSAAEEQDGPKNDLGALARELTAVYWGQSVFVEDDSVAAALREFYQTVRDFQSGWAKVENLKLKAEGLVQACKGSITKNALLGAAR